MGEVCAAVRGHGRRSPRRAQGQQIRLDQRVECWVFWKEPGAVAWGGGGGPDGVWLELVPWWSLG